MKNKLLEHIVYLFNEWNLDISKAEDFAQQIHLNQKRKVSKDPYIIHPKRVQLLAKKLGLDKELQIVALLHDVLEDGDNVERLSKFISQNFGPTVLAIVKLLTHDKSTPYNKYLLTLATYNSNLAKKAFSIKMLDMYSNLLDNPSEKQFKKYKDAIMYLIKNGINVDLIPDSIMKILNIKKLQEEDTEKKSKDKDNTSDAKEPSKAPKSDKDTKPSSSDAETGGEEEKTNTNVNDDGAEGSDDDSDVELGGNTPPLNNKSDMDDMDVDGSEMDDSVEDEEDEGEKITKFSDDASKIKKIKSQRIDSEPNFNFDITGKAYRKYYMGITENNSIIFAVPQIYNQNKKFISFVSNILTKYILPISKKSIKNNKKMVILEENDNNYTYKLINRYLLSIYKNKKIKKDLYGYNDYLSFIRDSSFISKIKSASNMDDINIKSAIYLYFLLRDGKKYKLDEDVINKLNEWGLDNNNLLDTDKIVDIIYPEIKGNVDNEASYIIKIFIQQLRIKLIKKVYNYEKLNYFCIVPSDKYTAWYLSSSFNNFKKFKNKENSKNAK